MKKSAQGIFLCMAMASLLYGCAFATSSNLGGNRHVVEVRGVYAEGTELYQKWEQKASKICNGRYGIIERHVEEPLPGGMVVIGTVECQ